MEKIFTLTSAILLLSLSVKADLITVTACGTVEFSYNTLYGTYDYTGKNVEYTFQFNKEKDGYYLLDDGPIYLSDDSKPGLDDNYFYSNFLGDYVLPVTDVQLEVKAFNCGFICTGINDFGDHYVNTHLQGGSLSHSVEIWNIIYNEEIIDWQVGTSLNGWEYSYITNDGSYCEYAYSNLIITSISTTSVPEPALFSMMLCSITLLGAFGSMKRKWYKK